MSETTGIDLSGQTAIVTGGSRGIGRAIVLALARHGANVAVVARSAEGAESAAAAARELGVRAEAHPGDVSDVCEQHGSAVSGDLSHAFKVNCSRICGGSHGNEFRFLSGRDGGDLVVGDATGFRTYPVVHHFI